MEEGLELCHCTDCRSFTGALAGGYLHVDPDNVAIKSGDGELKSYTTTSDAGNRLTRYWCGTCGSSLYATSSREGSDEVMIHAGELVRVVCENGGTKRRKVSGLGFRVRSGRRVGGCVELEQLAQSVGCAQNGGGEGVRPKSGGVRADSRPLSAQNAPQAERGVLDAVR